MSVAEAIAYVAYRVDKEDWPVLYFASQAPDVDVDSSGTAIVIVTPYCIKQMLARENLAGIGGEEFEELGL